MKKDRIIGLILVAMAITVAIATANMTTSKLPVSGDPGPRLMPYIASALLGVCGIGIIIQAEGESKPTMSKKGWLNCAGLLAICLVYVLILEPVGYLLSSALALAALLCWIVYAKDGKEHIKPLRFLLYSAVVTVAFYAFFTKVLNVVLPRGILFF